MTEILPLAVIGWGHYQDAKLIRSIVLMSRNIDNVVYPIIDDTHTLHTPPLFFDFFNRPTIFWYNQAESDLLSHIQHNILVRSNGVLFSLGGIIRSLREAYTYEPFNTKAKQEDISYLKAVIDLIKQSPLPVIYALEDETGKQRIEKMLGIQKSDLFVTYNYNQPSTLKQVLRRLFEVST